MSKTQTIHINFTGGIVSPGYLKEVLELAAKAKVAQVQFGLRQNMWLEVPANAADAFTQACIERKISFFTQKNAGPNIVSSYPAAGLFTADTWVREGVYKDIFNQFDYAPAAKINICDSTQNLVPFFTGHINWISANAAHFWHLYIRFPKTQQSFCWPELVYTNDIGNLSKAIEQILVDKKEELEAAPQNAGNLVWQEIKQKTNYTGKPRQEELQLPRFSLPYYEGFNQSETGLWLGIYRRDQQFALPFLIDVCNICMASKIGQLYTTPWKSLIIKGIKKEQVEQWNWVLGKYRINVRHAANELAWQVEDGDESGLLIKRHIIRHFDKEDVRTYGLSFGVQSKPTASMFGSIIIRKQQNKNPHRLKSLERYDLLHTRNFNPNAADLVLFREGVEKEHLGTYLVSLCKLFYQQQEQTMSHHVVPQPEQNTPAKTADTIVLHQCPNCLTVYDGHVGDGAQDIAAGTTFAQLPDQYVCPLCETEKEAFREINAASLQLL